MSQVSKRPANDSDIAVNEPDRHESASSPKRRREATYREPLLSPAPIQKVKDTTLTIVSDDEQIDVEAEAKTMEIVEMTSFNAYIDRLKECNKFRKLYYGTTNFLICLGLTCNLTMNTIFTALTIVHRSTVKLALERIDRRCYSAAALCLSWKYWEDREGMKRNHKIKDLACGIYLVSRLPSKDQEGNSLLTWIRRDSSVELNRLRERIKLYEVLILRALHLNILNDEYSYLTGYFSAATRSLCPEVENNIESFDTLQAVALGVVMDFCRWPLMAKYPLKSIVFAAVLKSAIILKVPLIQNDNATITEQQQMYMDIPYLSEVAECIRLTYDWTAELTSQEVT